MQNRTSQWRAVERKRAEYLVWARQKFRVALRRQLMQFQKASEDAVVVGDLSRGVNFISDQPVRDAFNDVYVKVGGGFAVLTNQQLKSAKGYRVKDLVVSDYQDFLQSWVASYAGERIVGITQTSQDLMSRIIQRAFDEGMSIDEAKRLINKQFPQYSIARSEVIARTEIVSASNLGSISSARATGLTLNKVWLATRDSRTRDDHASADMQKVGINEMFNVGGENLEFPGDPFGSPGNVISCRCTLFYTEVEGNANIFESNIVEDIIAPEKPFQPLTIVSGLPQYAQRFERIVKETTDELKIKTPVHVKFVPLTDENVGGMVRPIQMPNGRWVVDPSNVIINTNNNDDKIKNAIRHELRHIKQGLSSNFYMDATGVYWNKKFYISISQYNQVVRSANMGDAIAYRSYRNFPWEVQARKFAGDPD